MTKIENIKHSLGSAFFKSVSTLVSGTVLAQAIPILIQPILRRYYSPEIFGAYAVYLSLIGILYGITSLRYEQAIVLPEHDKEAKSIFTLAQLLNLLLCAVFFIIILLFKDHLSDFLNLPHQYSFFLFLVPLATFLFNLQQAINLSLIRNKLFMQVSKIKVFRRSIEGVSQISFQLLKQPAGLLFGDILGHIVSISYGIRLYFKRFGKPTFNKTELFSTAKKYSVYPKVNTVSSFFSAASLLLPTLFVNKFFGSENAAYFDLSRLLLLVPISLLAASISNVMLQRISEKKRDRKTFVKEVSSILLLGAGIAFVELIIILPFGEKLFSFVFGTQWLFSGTLSKYLLWPFVFQFLIVSFSSVFLGLQEIKKLGIFQTLNFLLILCLVFLRNSDLILFVKFYAFVSLISIIVYSVLLLSVIRNYNNSLSINQG